MFWVVGTTFSCKPKFLGAHHTHIDPDQRVLSIFIEGTFVTIIRKLLDNLSFYQLNLVVLGINHSIVVCNYKVS